MQSSEKESRACSWKQKHPKQCRGGARRAVCVQDLGVWLEYQHHPTQCVKAGSQSMALDLNSLLTRPLHPLKDVIQIDTFLPCVP